MVLVFSTLVLLVPQASVVTVVRASPFMDITEDTYDRRASIISR